MPSVGLEPTRISALVPKTSMSTNSITKAKEKIMIIDNYYQINQICQYFILFLFDIILFYKQNACY